MQTLTQPTLLLKPFAESGDKNTIPVTNSDASNPQLADLTNGFPEVTSLDPDDGGIPAERKDFNALGYLTTTYDFFYQAGGTFTYNATIASAIGGYPLGARLWYDDGNGHTAILKSTKGNNTDNFVTTPSFIGTSWVSETPVLSWNNTWTGNNTFSNKITGNISGHADGDVGLSLNNTISGANTFTSGTTFSAGISVGGASSFSNTLTATTPSSATDNSTKVATTAWVNNHLANATVKSNEVYNVMPNYANGYAFTSGATTSSNGWLKIRFLEWKNASVTCDGVTIYDHAWGGGDYGTQYQVSYIPIPKGKVVTYANMASVTFYPCIGG